jgi:glutathione S-transferase
MIRVWGRPTSTRTQRVLWALTEIGLDFDFVLASGTMGAEGSVYKGNTAYGIIDTPEYRAMNPMGKIPTLDDNGFTLWESNTIVRYLAMKYAPELMYGGGIETFALASRWMDWDNVELIPGQHELVMQLVRLTPAERDPVATEKARQEQVARFQVLDDQLGRTRYVAGGAFTMGDIPVGIHARRWDLFGLDHPPMPNLERWYGELRQRPAFRTWVEDPAHHLAG